MRRKIVVACGSALIVGLLAVLVFRNTPSTETDARDNDESTKASMHRSDVAVVNFPKSGEKNEKKSRGDLAIALFHRQIFIVLIDTRSLAFTCGRLTNEELKHPQVQSAVEALKTGEHPERLSPLVQGTAFVNDSGRMRFIGRAT